MDFNIAVALDLIRNTSNKQLQPYLPNITYTIQRLQKLPINTFQHSPPLSKNKRGHYNSLHTPLKSKDVQPSLGSKDIQPFLGNKDNAVQSSPKSVQPSPENKDVVKPSPKSKNI